MNAAEIREIQQRAEREVEQGLAGVLQSVLDHCKARAMACDDHFDSGWRDLDSAQRRVLTRLLEARGFKVVQDTSAPIPIYVISWGAK